MSQDAFSRRGLLKSAALAPAAAGAAAAQQQTPRQAVVQNPYPESNLAQPGPVIKVLSITEFDADEIAKFVAAGGATKIEFEVARNRQEFRDKLREAEVVFGSLNASEIDYAPKLKWIQTPAAGMESTDPKLMASNFVLTNMARAFAPGIAETAIGLLLNLTRGISTYYMPQFYKRQMRGVGTSKSPDHIELAGRTAGIVGMGGIGSEIARRLYYGFGMKILATDAKPMPKPEYVEELHDPNWFRTMVPKVEVLISAAPHTKATDKMFNEDVFRSMKKTAYFIAMSRGGLFDDMALVKALKEKWIMGAGLDVFPVEPPPPTHPIYDCTNVVMTAHTSGWGVERQTRLVALFAENLRRYAHGLPLVNVVDKQKGY